jgi:hypothetical protein
MGSQIKVTVVDAASGATMGEVDFPSDQLPASFAARSTLHLGDDDWTIERADPLTAPEFIASGRLRLVVRRVVKMDPKNILFSLPTLSHELPALDAKSAPAAGSLQLAEDDWRQIELVASGCDAAVAACLSAIERIYADHRRDSGAFDEIHIRNEVPQPLAGTRLTLDALRAAFPGCADLPAVTIGPARVRDGFALRLPSGPRLYGLLDSGHIAVLGIDLAEHHRAPANAGAADAKSLAALMRAHDLRLVSWCRMASIPADEAALRTWLSA